MSLYSHRRSNWNSIGSRIAVLLVCGVSLWRLNTAHAAQSSVAAAKTLYQQAVHEEDATGNLKAAIALHERVLSAKPDRALAAQTLIHMAECYQKLGDKESQKVYERIARDFEDQKDAAAEARSRLAALRSPATPQAVQAARRIWMNAGTTVTPPSADGRYLAFYDNDTGDVAVRDLKEGTKRRITNAAGAGEHTDYMAISPDGHQVAYTGPPRRATNCAFCR